MQVPDCIEFCKNAWLEGGFALEGLKDLIRIPNLSPGYDPEYHTNGLIHKAIHSTADWINAQGLKGCHTTIYEEKNREPLLFVEIDSTTDKPIKSVLTYGHLDKMPHLDAAGWSEGLSATNPVVRGNKVYGRGTNDDGYNGFLVIAAVKYLQAHNLPHPRIVMLLEAGEESGDDEIVHYLAELKDKIGDAGAIWVLDAEAQDYETVWCCKSLRGVAMGALSIEHLKVPCHSGMATGLVPSTFRIARMLLSRIEDEATGEMKLKSMHVDIPQNRRDQANAIAEQLGERCVEIVTPLEGAKLLSDNLGDLLVAKGWKPGLEVTGADGIPSIGDGSNVVRPKTALKLSIRLPPGVSSEKVNQEVKEVLEKDPPYGARVEYKPLGNGDGWFGRDFDAKTQAAIDEGCKEVFGKQPLLYGEGGSIPLCNLLQEMWPEAQIVVTGCAGTDSNPHGYDESLDLPYTGKFTAFFAYFLNHMI